MSNDELLAVIGYAPQHFREYAYRAASEVAALWVLTPQPEPWLSEYSDQVTQVQLDGPDALDVLTKLLANQVAGVLTFDERYVELTARLQARLGLSGATPEAVRTFKDKAAMRALTSDAPFAVRTAVAQSLEEAEQALTDIGYPAIVKPRALGGSIGVKLVQTPTELAAAFALAQNALVGTIRSAHSGVLIEEYVVGPEVSVDSSIVWGQTSIHVVADKILGEHPYFEEFGHTVPSSCGNETLAALRSAVRAIHAAAEFDNGISHIEFRLTSTGPKLIEANARLGGDLIPYLGLLAHGVNVAQIAAQIALGKQPNGHQERGAAAAIRFLYPEHPLTFAGITWNEAATASSAPV